MRSEHSSKGRVWAYLTTSRKDGDCTLGFVHYPTLGLNIEAQMRTFTEGNGTTPFVPSKDQWLHNLLLTLTLGSPFVPGRRASKRC